MNNTIPKLNFLGCGSAFNTAFGPTSAYMYLSDTELLLFECGAGTFDRIKPILDNPLNNIGSMYIVISHMHPDHVADLGNIIFYMYFRNKVKPIIYTPTIEFSIIMTEFLRIQGIGCDMYKFSKCGGCYPSTGVEIDAAKQYVLHSAVNNNHVDNISCYYTYLKHRDTGRYIIWSGDTSKFPPPLDRDTEDEYVYDKCDGIYIEMACGSAGGIHFDVLDLIWYVHENKIPRELITGMHFDSEVAYDIAKSAGRFNVPPI